MSILGKLISDGLGDAGQEVAEKAVSKSLKKAAKETGESALAKLGKKIPVSYTDDIVQDIAVKAPEMQKLYRGIKAETPEKLEKYIDDMFNPTIKPRTYEGSAYGEGYYFTPFRDSAESYASNDLAKPYQAVLEIEQPRNRFIGINKQNQNRPVDFAIRAEKRVGGGRAASVGERDFDNYLKKNGILGDRVNDNITVIKDNDAVKNMRVAGRKEPGKDWDYSAMLGENEIAQSLKNAENYLPNKRTLLDSNPDVMQSNGPSLVDMARNIKAMRASQNMATDGIRRIGSSEVAKIDPSTLPAGWEELEKYLDSSAERLPRELGIPKSKITKDDLANYLEEIGYDNTGTKDEMWKNALMAIDDNAFEELYNSGGGTAAGFLQTRLPFRHNSRLTDATNYYIGNKGRTGRLDAEYSDRLGIGRSNTPMSDNLVNPYSSAGGDYSEGAFGTSPTWATGESGVSTAAHERLHAWQDINKFDWDEGVVNAIDELRDELKKFYHDNDTLKKYHGGGKLEYYADPKEQEARMLQSYLDNEGYTNTYKRTSEKGTEWGKEIKPAFDKFFNKLRALSKKGVALPAIAGLVGVGAMASGQNSKNENS